VVKPLSGRGVQAEGLFDIGIIVRSEDCSITERISQKHRNIPSPPSERSLQITVHSKGNTSDEIYDS